MLTTSNNLRFAAELERRRRLTLGVSEHVPEEVTEWLKFVFPQFFSAPFADHHIQTWNWVESIDHLRPKPLVLIVGRGGAKSTTAEAIPVRLGAQKKRKYCWYVSGTQDKADSHVLNISALLENRVLSVHYPDLARRAVGKYGNAKGWRRSRVSTASGLTVDALGLDTGSRGVKFEDQRPDLIILDDVDDRHDSLETTEKKIEMITQSILPSGSTNCAVVFIQNLITEDSIASRLVDGRADFLRDKILIGPIPALQDFSYELGQDDQGNDYYFIRSGIPTWEGQNRVICEEQLNTWGPTSFKREAQHEVEETGGLWDDIIWKHIKFSDLPDILRTVVWCDPAISTTDDSDSMGVSVGGVDERENLYGLRFREKITTPEECIEFAIDLAYEYGCSYVGIETDQGGDTWKSVFLRALDRVLERRRQIYTAENGYPKGDPQKPPDYRFDKAGAGYGSKAERNLKLHTYYEQGKVYHVVDAPGSLKDHQSIEKSLRRFPKKPLDLADSWWWCYRDLVDQPGWLKWAKEKSNESKAKQSSTGTPKPSQ